MKITTYKTDKKVQAISESSTERRVVDGFFLTIIDGVLIDVEYDNTSADVLTIPDDVRVISKQAFEGVCVKEVILPTGLESIEDEAFRKSTLEKIDLTNVKSLGDRAFEFSELREVTYSKYMTYVPEMCFKDSKLAAFEIPKQVTALKTGCFENTNLKTINLSGIITLDNGIFFNCLSLREIILPKTITKIPVDFCQRCQCLEKINLSHVQFIGMCAFSGCSNLDAGNLSAEIDKYAFEGTAVKNLEIENISKVNECAYRGCDKLESVTISGNGIIPSGLFAECSRLKNVTINEGITSIGESAFRETVIKKLILPSTVITVNDNAFAYCGQLEKAVLDERLDFIGWQAFMNTMSLSEISIPDKVEHIGSKCFSYSGIKSVKLPKNDSFTIIHDKTFFECTNLEEVMLPDSVYQIGSYAFTNCKSLQHINLDNIKQFYDKAFAGTALEKITLTARKIGPGAFAQCENLREADLSGITDRQINSHLFFECTNLAKINLPKEQIRIFDSNCFYHTALEEIVFDAKEVTVRQGAFGLTNLKKVVIGKTCDSVQIHDYAFHQADVEEFVIPDSLSKHFNVILDRIF